MEYVRQTGCHQYASSGGGGQPPKVESEDDNNTKISERKAGMWESVFSVNTLM